MTKSRRVLKILAWALGILASLTLILLVSTYYILRSPAMQQKILASIQTTLGEAGLKTEIDRLSIDLFGGVSLDGLRVLVDRPPLAVGAVKLDQLRLRYAFWPLLQRRLEISELLIAGLDGDLRLVLPESAPEPESPPPDIEALLNLLRHPPLTLDSPELEIRAMHLKIDLTKGPLHADAELNGAAIKLSAAVKPGAISSAVDLKLPLTLALTMDGDKPLKLSTAIDFAYNPTFKLELSDDQLTWKLDGEPLELAIERLKMTQGPAATGMNLSFDHLQFRQGLSAQHQSAPPTALAGLVWPLNLEMDQTLALSPLSFEQGKNAALTAQLALQLDNKLRATIPDLDHLESAAWSIATDVKLAQLRASQSKKLLAATPSFKLSIKGEGEKGEGQINSQISTERLESSFVLQPLDFLQLIQTDINFREKKLKVSASHRLNDLDLLTLQLEAADPADKHLSGHLAIAVKTDPSLAKLHAGAAALEKIGFPTIDLKQDFTLDHDMPLQKIQKTDLPKLTITNSLTADIKQTQVTSATLLRFAQLRLSESMNWLAEQLKGELAIELKELQHPALARAIDVTQKLTFEGSSQKNGANPAFLQGKLHGDTLLGSAPLLTLDASLREVARQATIESRLLLTARPDLQKDVAALKILTDTGPLQIASEQTITIDHGAPSLQQMPGFDLKKVNIEASLIQKIESLTPTVKSLYRLIEPLRIDTKAKLVRGRGDINTRILIPDAEARDVARVKDVRVGLIASVSDLDAMALAEAKAVVQIAAVDLQGELGKKPELQGLLRQIQLILHATVAHKTKISVKNLYASLQNPLLQFRGQGDFTAEGRGDFTGKLDVAMPEEAKAGLRGKGHFQLPLQITLYDKQKISVQAEPRFQAFSLDFGDISVRNAQGSVQIFEELALDKKGKIGFLYLNSQNPFVRVDYESVEPYVGNPTVLAIEKVRFKHIELGPIVENFEVRQNLVYLNDFKADLLGGSALGRLYFDLHPERLQLGFLGRFSNLQPELLKEPGRRQKGEKAVLSGRMGTSFDIRQRLAAGRIDITAIGKQQLMSLLDVLDPEYKDSQIGMARRGIQVAYPRFVAISMNQGLMDLTIGLGGIISKDIVIRSIPLSALINAKLGTTLQRIESLVQSGDS